MIARCAVAGVLLFTLAACGPGRPPEGVPTSSLTVAAAANLTGALTAVSRSFEDATGIRTVITYASTAQLARQIENGAPYDLFVAADTSHVDQLERKGLIVPGTRAVYARGVLALWVPPTARTPVPSLAGLTEPGVRVIAIAKPDLAPYGAAAVESLQHLGIWDQVKAKVVYAENINMAKQYGAAGNADAVFTAYSLVFRDAGTTLKVAESLHQPIDQALGILARSRNAAAAREFSGFLITGKGKQILADYGYQSPKP
jgi:molybdate transport system substrate-binding protein